MDGASETVGSGYRIYQVVAALIRRGGEVLLVRQQRPGDAAAAWALPGGAVKSGELLPEALAREVREETGLAVELVGQLVSMAQLDNQAEGYLSTAFVFEVARWAGAPPSRAAAPDALVSEARFMPLADAIDRLDQLPWRAMREPIVAYLRGEVRAGALWCYRREQDGSEALVQQKWGNAAGAAADPGP
jgi:8-oxo-dGTP diphosphatase